MCAYEHLNFEITRYKRFKGFDQQDSHEAFRCLLDGLRMEEIKVFTMICIEPCINMWLPCLLHSFI